MGGRESESTVKVALVTGASRGIGRSIALTLAAAGYRVIGTARASTELEHLGAELALANHPGFVVPADLQKEGDVGRLFADLAARTGRLDVVVNNAGIARIEPFGATTVESWRAVLSTNLDAVFLMTQPAVRWMLTEGGGHLVFIASDAAIRGIAQMAAYCASKHGVLGLARALAEELRGSGIRITTILPGPVNTTITGSSAERTDLPQPEDIAASVAHALAQPSRAEIREVRVVPASHP